VIDAATLWGLAGVVLGFALSEAASALRYRLRICRLKKGLQAECQSLTAQIPLLIDILQKTIENLRQKRILPGPAVRAISTVYNSVLAELTPYLTPLERNLLHVVYEHLRVGDDTLAGYTDDLLVALRDGTIDDPWQVYIDRMTDLVENYTVTQELLQSYLRGQPIDVFYLTAGTRGKV
jgi:hypothetical protein